MTSRAARLAPTIGDRLSTLLRPGSAHTTLVRRLFAVLLAGLGLALLLRPDPATVRASIVVAGHDLTPGQVLTAADLQTVHRQTNTVPDGAIRDAAAVTGRTVAGAVRRGDTLTDVRLLGRRLAVAATGNTDARIVPIRLADTGVADLLREGDRVDVVATADGHDSAAPAARVLARNAVVVLVARPPGAVRGTDKDPVVMIAMAVQPATAVAAASLNTALTVLFH